MRPIQPLLPGVPSAGTLWARALIAGFIAIGLFLLDRLTLLLADYWFFESVSLQSLFWTNFRMGTRLFLIGLVAFMAAIYLPAVLARVQGPLRRRFLAVGVFAGVLAGYELALHYREFLVMFGEPFGETDPVFGRDISFYVFTLPSVWLIWRAAFWLLLAALASSLVAAWAVRRATEGAVANRAIQVVGHLSTPGTIVVLALLDVLLSVGAWLTRYNLLFRDNTDSAVYTGAAYLDVSGFFTHLNAINVLAIAIVADTAGLVLLLTWFRRHIIGKSRAPTRASLKFAVALFIAPLLLDAVFRSTVSLRDVLAVKPNQPVIQLEYIERHINATLHAYRLDGLETASFEPAVAGDPLPDLGRLLSSPSIRNAPLWPGFSSRLERLIDPQHANRILITGGDKVVYGPTEEIFRQQQKLRTYYDFMDVDAVRYEVDGEQHMFVSAVRELPLVEPQEWLAWWGQRFVLFTHGHGLVMIDVKELDPEGGPRYVSAGIPIQTTIPSARTSNPRVYYGEGASSVAFTNVRQLKEFDYPTAEGRAEMILPDSVPAGVRVSSPIRRLVFGWRSRQFFEIFFSRLIGADTRVHYYRTPLGRAERIAPFLYFDTDPFAVAVDGRIVWMLNAMTTTDRYPYSRLESLGDKSDERSVTPRPHRRVNYVRDAAKVTVDAYTGAVRFYGISDDPILRTWQGVYPDLFAPASTMPAGVRKQMQYPLQLFHIQFDDIYKLYHMTDPITFFNMEDAWDDADEVLGPIIDRGASITFSTEPQNWIAETRGDPLPPARTTSQFALSMAFTNEKALNLRAIVTAYQDGEDYGRLLVLTVPKARFVTGPEQADAIIDQDPFISQHLTWWNRLGNDVIRGHTTTLLVGSEVLYVEPVFTRSQQNPTTQMKRVIVVFRGRATMAATLDEALRALPDFAGQGTPLLGVLDQNSASSAQSTRTAAPMATSVTGTPTRTYVR
ncbi:MAG: UPF0182 family protein [Gemmatimonadetes bacterium]|nr:UPF0182 family protein [Gemmatimonadota bacterium]